MEEISEGIIIPKIFYIGYDLSIVDDGTPYRTTSSNGRIPVPYDEFGVKLLQGKSHSVVKSSE